MSLKNALLFVLLCIITACVTRDPLVTLNSETSLSGDAVTIRIDHAPNLMRISAERAWGWRDKTIYRSTAVFKAMDGVIDVSAQAPISGSYDGVSPAGMFWSMTDTKAPAPDPIDSETVTFSFDFGDDGTIDHRSEIRLKKSTENIEETSVGNQLPGAFLLKPADIDMPPVVILVGGSEGGDSAARNIGPKLAARGYAVFGLPYYSPAYGNAPQQFPSLPRAFDAIPIDKIEIARDWLRARADINSSQIALYGASKGAEFVLEAASRIDGFNAVAAIVPSDVIWEGWGPGTEPGKVSSFSWRGAPLPFVPYEGMADELAKFSKPEETVRIRTPHDAGRLQHPDRAVEARIKVENIDEPVFLVGGDEDNTWASGPMARNIKATRDAAGLETTLFVGELSGHSLTGDGYSPMDGSRDYAAAAEEAILRLEAWRSLLSFLATHLDEMD